MGHSTTLEVRRDDYAQLRVREDPLPESLEEGQVLLAVDHFALTANNITYCQVGEAVGYWRFFPSDDPSVWGRVPAMGYASVAVSAHPDIGVGERVWGFFPMSTHLLINAGQVHKHGFSDLSAHREGLAPIYCQFQRAAANPLYEPAREAQDCLLRGLFLTSWLCEDALQEHDYYGASDCLITSASSKTSIALAFALRDRGAVRRIALTSARNRAFCESLGCYDEVFCYAEVTDLPLDRKVILVDMAGDGPLNSRIHRHFGDQLRYDCRIGMTHRDAPAESEPSSNGPKPEMFFAPHQAAKRSADWGADVMEQRIGTSFARFRVFADSWLGSVQFDGAAQAQQAFLATLRGAAAPSDGYSLSMNGH
ncbi:MAG: hypothetical protein ACI87W_000044 [Halieaceae bacterium]|jgi:hypothetical protein